MKKQKAQLPRMEDIVRYLNENEGKVGKREIARAFHIKGDDRVKLKEMLKTMKSSGQIEKTVGKTMKTVNGLPELCPCEITGTDSDGELVARPLNWTANTPKPQILITDLGRIRPAPAVGEQVILKLSPKGKRFFHGQVIRRLSEKPNRIVGLFQSMGAKGGRISSVDRRIHQQFVVEKGHTKDAKNNDIVVAEVIDSALGKMNRRAKVVEIVGASQSARAASLIALHMHGIPTEFTPEALKSAEKAKLPALNKRKDLRHIPLVTIDGEDARDFDDAIFAEPCKEGFHLIVAIADVAYFVRPNSPLDDCAKLRGNSVYFPDRCIPMLPFALSNELCSLKPNVDRPCMVAHLWINNDGILLKYKFERAMIKSAARLNYHEVQQVFDGKMPEMNNDLCQHLLDLKSAFHILEKARIKRNALEIDVIEQEIKLDENGNVQSISPRERLDSHRTVEEFMILANVAAAMMLEEKEIPAMYRVHEQPSAEKSESLQKFLNSIGLKISKSKNLQSSDLNNVLSRVKGTPKSNMISDLVLRSQSQARYSPNNLGHFGLALERYAHFTSPIRRYSDLIVHRGLISALKLGNDGLTDENGDITVDLEDIGEHISGTERRAVAAERDAVERYLSAYLKNRIGERFSGVISGVSRFGIFVKIDDIGAEGLIPISTLPRDYYNHDEANYRIVGQDTGNAYELGQHIEMTLAEAMPVTGGLLFHILDAGKPCRKKSPAKKGKKTQKKHSKYKQKRK